MLEFNKISRMLGEVETALVGLSGMSPDELLASDYTRSAFKDTVKTLCEYKFHIVVPAPFFITKTIDHLCEIVTYLETLVGNFNFMCDVVHQAHPCETHTLDLPIDLILRDFLDFGVHKGLGMQMEWVKLWYRLFLDNLKSLSSTCIQLYGANCLKYASPDEVFPASPRSYVLDLVSVVRYVDRKFTETYRGIRKWKVGRVLFYDQHGTTREFLDLAEYVANVLHKQLEIGTVSTLLEDKMAVLSLRNMVEILIRDIREMGDIIVKPGWIIDVYADLDTKLKIPVLKRVFEEMGFKTEPTAFGLRVTIPPGDIMEAVKIASTLPSMPATEFVEHAYPKAVSVIRMLELKLKEQKPLKRRKISL